MIHVRQLSKAYEDEGELRTVVHAVDFDVLAGQVFGLLGPNGAGKTTILRILATVLKPTAGSVSVNGFDVVREPDLVRRQIGYVTTNTAIYERMTGWEMVEYFGRLHGLPPRPLHRRMEELFSQLGMDPLRHVLGSTMSTGMRQKVSIARALIHDPPVLIIDEATSGLDVVAAREVLTVIEQLRAYGKCILFSSHIMSEVRRLCDYICILSAGRVVAAGTTRELSERFAQSDMEELFYQLISRHHPPAPSSLLPPPLPNARA